MGTTTVSVCWAPYNYRSTTTTMSNTFAHQCMKLAPLTLIVIGLLSYNFMSAQWAGPTGVAPSANTSAPINVSANYQAKLGDLGAVRMRAGEYCNADGTVCFTANEFDSLMSTSTPAPTCSPVITTVRGTRCWTAPACPAGSVKVDTRQAAMSWCAGDSGDWTYDVDCLTISCR